MLEAVKEQNWNSEIKQRAAKKETRGDDALKKEAERPAKLP